MKHENLYGGQFTLSTPLINQIFVILPTLRFPYFHISPNATKNILESKIEAVALLFSLTALAVLK